MQRVRTWPGTLQSYACARVLVHQRHPHCAQAVQPHVRKCFEGVRRLEFGEGGSEVVALVSAEGERTALAKPVKARGGVESWLGGVEAAMGASLRRLCHAAMHAYAPQVPAAPAQR